ncbi:hypothetical protein C4597_02355 [Weissella koreensis]|nr:hypothetical protein C4597_02355 [Weissella koreensis]
MFNKKQLEKDMNEIDETLLNDAYFQIYVFLDKDKDKLVKFVDKFGEQQINFPVHLYDREKVVTYLSNKLANNQEIDVAFESRLLGYSKRWVNTILREYQKSKIQDEQNGKEDE